MADHQWLAGVNDVIQRLASERLALLNLTQAALLTLPGIAHDISDSCPVEANELREWIQEAERRIEELRRPQS